MKCPLIHIKLTVNETSYEGQPQECLKEDCARWDNVALACVDLSIKQRLEWIAQALNEIVNRIPPHIPPH